VFGGGLKNGIEHLSNLLGSAFPSDFLNLQFDRVFLVKHLSGKHDAPKRRSIRAPMPRNLDLDSAFW
jgi:hypothetical protein